ncbi:hypothetical protein N657DRAFT_675456 [Parathielavia appendiculata]|uniref:HMA domain-containing protein n=1 Tax=Parathielavia appendiculata TaxID=2587402 RepID=A0AAN6YZN2_9PEZI|nr:hypothetical protein N657DRAFT_675456 [Parathielavia appendiculata]
MLRLSSPANDSPNDEKSNLPPCCEGKPASCCDLTCVDRLALRACEDKKYCSIEHRDASSADQEEPCGYHSRKTRDAYGATLEALGCICRALLALGEDSCCLPKGRSYVERRHSLKRPSRRLRPAVAPPASCYSSPSQANGQCHPRSSRSSRSNSIADSDASDDCCSAGSCGRRQPAATRDPCSKGCCGGKAPSVGDKPAPVKHTDETCCKPSGSISKDHAIASADVEKGLCGREHVILSVSGVTCTGCETKLQRVLSTLPSVKNLKTSLVLTRAEFDLDFGSGSLTEVLKHLERTTEFKCESVGQHPSTVDILPKGVTDVVAVDKQTVRVAHDPELAGARDLLEGGWGDPLELAPLGPDPTIAAGNKHVRHMGYMTVLSIALTIPVLVLAWAPLPEHEMAYSFASLALVTVIQVVVAGPFYPKALKALVFSRVIEMDLIIVLSTSAAYVFCVVSFDYFVSEQPLSTGSFFEASTLLVTLVMPATAILIDKTSGSDREIDDLACFSMVTYSVSCQSRGSQPMVRPVEKHVGSAFIAGAVNGSGTLTARVIRLPGANTIDMIAGIVDQARLSKPKLQHIADRVASYYVPVAVELMVVTLVAWIAVGVAGPHQSGAEATIQAITYAIAVLIVSCPCAIGLAVPMVVVIATGVAAEHSVIFKSAESMEVAYRASHVVLDKTGTLTEGRMSVVAEQYVNGDSHPVSVAVRAHLKSNWKDVSVAEVIGTINDTLAAIFGLQDSLRQDALTTIQALHGRNIVVHVLSGDDDGAVRRVPDHLNILPSRVRSRCTPANKQSYIQDLLSTSPSAREVKRPG